MMTDNKEYRLKLPSPDMDTKCIHNVSEMDTEQNVTQRNPNNIEKKNVTQRSEAERSGYDDKQTKMTMLIMTQGYGLDTRLIKQAINEYGCELVHKAVVAWKKDSEITKVKPIDFPSYLKKAIENGGNQ